MAYSTASGIDGWAFAPGSSRRFAARIVPQGDYVKLIDADGKDLAAVQLDRVQVDPPLGSAARRMTFPDGTMFETEDHAAIEALTGETRGGILHKYERFGPHMIGMVVACMAAVWLLYRYGLDLIVTAAIALTPPVLVAQIDRGTLQTIDYLLVEETKLDLDEQRRITQIFFSLLDRLPSDVHENHEFEILFRSAPGIGPNAFALPGGTVVMTDEFAQEFPSEDIIAGVLGHEIGHVVDQHGLRQMYRALGIYVLIAFLAGDTGPLLEDIVLEGNVLLSLPFSRAHESEADKFGLQLAADSGYDPNGLKQFFERIEEIVGTDAADSWLSTHPSNDDRIQQIDDFIDAM